LDLQEAIRSRRAVREYTTEPVSKSALEWLIDSAIQAPSAVNEQPWHFTVVQDQRLLGAISDKAKAYLLHRPPAEAHAEHFKQILADSKFDIFYRAPALIVVSSVSRDEWAVENCTLAAENLMLAACAEGLGTCWIGFAQRWLGTHEGLAALGLAESYLPVAPIIVGHPRSKPASVPRKRPEIRWIG
jgi:nitroreductase